jgi:hypothetical protein
MANATDSSADKLSFHFLTVEEKPLMDLGDRLTIVVFSGAVLVVGILINARIFTILSNRSNAAAMDKESILRKHFRPNFKKVTSKVLITSL